MKHQHRIDFIVGLFVICGIIAFAVLATKVSGLSDWSNGKVYRVTAEFADIGDLKDRAPVVIGGVTVGRVEDIKLDAATYKAIVTLDIGDQVKNIPIDSTANIFTAGLIGANYISITPGYEEEYLKNGGKIEKTNPALILQNLVGQLLFSLKEGK
jgi:phospholipid/cholesterol/gamma-HCH transport system substrate-binding protein